MTLADSFAEQGRRHLLERCLFCDWTHEGTLEEGRQAHEAHRRSIHKITVPKRRPPRARNPFRSDKPVEENIERARKEGAAQWVGGGETA